MAGLAGFLINLLPVRRGNLGVSRLISGLGFGGCLRRRSFLGGRSFLFLATGAQQHQQYQCRRAKSPVLGCISRHKFTSVVMGLGIHLLRSARETALTLSVDDVYLRATCHPYTGTRLALP